MCSITVGHLSMCSITVVHLSMCSITVAHRSMCSITVVHFSMCSITVVHLSMCSITVVHRSMSMYCMRRAKSLSNKSYFIRFFLVFFHEIFRLLNPTVSVYNQDCVTASCVVSLVNYIFFSRQINAIFLQNILTVM